MFPEYAVVLGIFVVPDGENLAGYLVGEILNGKIGEHFISRWISSEDCVPVDRPTPCIRSGYIVGVGEPLQ